jgi:ArsR family transcriptional regulator
MYLSEVFKALGDETRLRIVNLLSKEELCVCQIIEALRVSQPNASKHLNRLRYAGVIHCRKISQWCFYRISDQFMENNAELMEFVLKKCQSHKVYTEDKHRLECAIKEAGCCERQIREYKQSM